jgi:hypothetical protein
LEGIKMEREKILETRKKKQDKTRELEKFYTEGKVEDILSNLEKRKKELIEEMVAYAKEHKIECKWSRNGNPIAWKVDYNPFVIENVFFKSIVPIGCQEPEYNAEKLSLAYDFYCELLVEVNNNIGQYPASLTSFCHFAGITLNTLRIYRNSPDLAMRTIAEKIYDQIGDTNITMSQLGIVKERSTMFKLKSQNEIVEKEHPKVNINIVEAPDMEKIEEKINKYKKFVDKKANKRLK